MKNKGFTLIEIIGSIVIIGILGVLAVVTFTSNMKGFREDYYVETVRTLTESGKEFFNDNKKYRPSDILTSQVVPISTLVSQKYLDEIYDYKGNSCSNNSYVIIIKNGKDDYTYHTCLVCPEDDYSNMTDKYCDEAWKNSTSIEYTIATPPELYVYLGTPRSELRDLLAIKASYVKKNSKGEVIGVVDGTGFDDTPTIYPENIDSVDTNKIGVYPINYEYQGKTTTGHVTVYKFEEPTFQIKKQEKYATDLAGHTTNSIKELYVAGTWTQRIYVTLSAGTSTTDAMPNTVNRYQWNKDGVWQDFCLGTACNEVEVTYEMNQDIKFRSISVDNKVSDETNSTNVKIDNTKPACTLNKSGQQKTSDWYTSDVTVTFNRKEDLVRTGIEDVSGVKYYNITISSGALSHTNNTQAVHNYDTKGVTYIGYVEDQARNFITCSIEFRRDATNPTCSLKTIGTRENASNQWYNSANVVITFNAKADLDDRGTNNNSSGIKITKVSGNGREHATLVTDPSDTDWVTYTGYVEDNAGNNVTCSTRYKKDSTLPNCSMDTSGTMGNDGWYRSDVSIFFTSHTDNLSGVRNYGIGSTTSSKTATHTTDTAGTTYTGHIIDEAGNRNTCTTTFKRDATPPNCTLKTTGSRENANNQWYNSASVAISFNTKNDLDDRGGTTNSSGIRTTKISGNGNEHATIVNDSSDTDWVTYTGYVEDIAGNNVTCSTRYKKDSTLPTCSMETSGTMGNGEWYKSNVSVYFTTHTDKLSGVRNYGIGSTTGDKSLTHKTDTAGTTYTGHIIDEAGNSNTCSVSFKRDATPPNCTLKTTGLRENSTNEWYNSSSVAISFNSKNDLDDQGVTTNSSGIKTTKISGNGNEHATLITDSSDTDWVTYTGYIEDTAGNSVTCSTRYKKDSTKPTCALTTSGTHASGNSWYQGNVTISFVSDSTNDNLSGIRSNRIGTSTVDGESVTHSTDTTGITYTATIVDNAGNSDTCSTTFKRDGTNPSCSITGHSNFSCSDATSKLIHVSFKSNSGSGTGHTYNTSTPQKDHSSSIATVSYNGVWTLKAIDEASNTYTINTTYCKITYDKNGGDSGPTKTSEILRETESADLTPTARKAGYKMVGWSTSSTGSALTSYTVPAESTKTLYAVYEKCKDGEYTNAAGTACKSCPDYYTDGAPVGSEAECEMHVPCGSYVKTATKDNVYCPAGKYSEKHTVKYGKTSSCTADSDGYWSGEGSCSQTQCPKNYRDGKGTTAESECVQSVECGKHVETANQAATGCDTGYYKGAHTVKYGKTSKCTKSTAGNYTASDQCSQVECPSGFTSKGGSSARTQCYKDATPSKWTKTTQTCSVKSYKYYFYNSRQLDGVTGITHCGSDAFTCSSSTLGDDYDTCVNNYQYFFDPETSSTASCGSFDTCDADHYGMKSVSCTTTWGWGTGKSSTVDSCEDSTPTCSSSSHSSQKVYCSKIEYGQYAGKYTKTVYDCVSTTTKKEQYCNRRTLSYDVTTHKCTRSPASYEFKSSEETDQTECSTTSSFTCGESTNGNSYVSACTVTEYTCSSDSTLSGTLCYSK